MGEKRAEIENAFGGSHVNVEFVTARWLTLHLSTRISFTSAAVHLPNTTKKTTLELFGD